MDAPPQNGEAPTHLTLPIPSEQKQEDYAPTLTVVGPDKKKFQVATSPQANRAMGQITVSRLRAILARKIEQIEKDDVVLETLELKNIIAAAATVEELSAVVYDPKGVDGAGGSEFERLAVGVVRAATEGAARGMNFSEKIEKMKKLGMKRVKPIEVVVAAVAEEEA